MDRDKTGRSTIPACRLRALTLPNWESSGDPAKSSSSLLLGSGFQTGVRGPKGVRDGFPLGPREDSEK